MKEYAQLIRRAYLAKEYTNVQLPTISVYGKRVYPTIKDYGRLLDEACAYFQTNMYIDMHWFAKNACVRPKRTVVFYERQAQLPKSFIIGNTGYEY